MAVHDNTSRSILIVFLIVLIFYLMSSLASILLPLVLAVLVAALFQPLIMALKKIRIPNFMILPLVMLISLGALFLIYIVISGTATDIADQYDYLSQKVMKKSNSLVWWVNHTFGSRYSLNGLIRLAGKNIDAKWVSNAAGNVLASLSSFAGSFVMFALYYIVLLSGMANYKTFIRYVGGDNSDNLLASYEKVQSSINSYMLIKTGVNLLNGLMFYLICVLFDVKFAVFWGFLTFLLSYIPTIGSVVSTVPPVLMCILQSDTPGPVLFLAASLVVSHFVIGNVIEPIIMGNHLKINTVTVIFGLVFWGYIWGIAGMILSVPLLVLIKIIFEQVPSLAIVARIMGSPHQKKIKKAPEGAS